MLRNANRSLTAARNRAILIASTGSDLRNPRIGINLDATAEHIERISRRFVVGLLAYLNYELFAES